MVLLLSGTSIGHMGECGDTLETLLYPFRIALSYIVLENTSILMDITSTASTQTLILHNCYQSSYYNQEINCTNYPRHESRCYHNFPRSGLGQWRSYKVMKVSNRSQSQKNHKHVLTVLDRPIQAVPGCS
jgi:hypothetical protein